MTTITETTDAAASSSTTYSMTPGDTFSGSISPLGDTDWIEIVVAAGQSIDVTMTGTGGQLTSGNNVTVALVDSSGATVAPEQDFGANYSNTTYTNSTGSAQTLYIKAYDFGNNNTGTYTVDVVIPPEATPLDALDWGGSAVPTTNVTVYFAAAGDTFDGVTSLGWTQTQIDNVMAALADMALGTQLTFTITNSAAGATFKMVTENNNGVSYSAYMNPPSETNPGVGVFNTANMDLDNLIQGSIDYFIIQHESGHALGLAHPHDTGGGSVIMRGVTSPFGDLGDYNLNQGVNTIMSYNPGYYEQFGYPSGTFGATAGPMALDLALLQIKYGTIAANTGNNTYTLPDANQTGTFFSCIWDTGGTDQIVYTGLKDVTISLIAATLDYSATGGGVVSYAHGVQGGFTIANSVIIENASGGSGDDFIEGNDVDNIIKGNAGLDTMLGGGGNDWLFGGSELDNFTGGSGNDWFAFLNTNLTANEQIHDYVAADYIYLGNFSGPLTFNSNATGGLLQGMIQVTTGGTGNVMVVTQSGAGMISADALQLAALLSGGLSGLIGAFVTHLFDADNNEDFKVKDVYYDANGLLDFQKFFYDAGQPLFQLYVDYDQTSAFAWSNFKNYYSAYGVIDYKWVIYDAGLNIWGAKTDYDQGSAFSWNYITYSYASAGVLDYVWTQYDAGQPLYASKTDYDQGSVFSWDHIVYAYASAGVLDYKWVYYDAGGSAPYAVKTDYDQANAFTWDYITQAFSAAGVLDYQWVFYDAGNPNYAMKVDYDQDNLYAWDQHVTVYDTPGHVINDYYV